MKLPSYKRLIDTDFKPEERNLIQQLAGTLNIGIETLYQALNKNLNLQDNISCTVKNVDVIVDASGNPKTKTSFTLDTTNLKVESLLVSRAQNITTTTSYPTTAPFVSFTQENNSIVLNNVTGIQANNLYRLRLIAFAN